MSNEAAEAAIDALMQCIFNYVPDECTAFWARCVMVDGRRDLTILYDTGRAANDVFALSLAPDARHEVSECFREYYEALKRPGKDGWQVATVAAEMEPDGDTHFHIDTSHDPIRESEMEKFTARWNDKYLGGRRIVPASLSRTGAATPPPLPVTQPPMEIGLMRLLEEAFDELKAKNEAVDQVFNLRQSSWSLDQTTCAIRFHNPNGTVACAPFQTIGTMNTQDGTWLWAWENPSIVEPLRQHALAMRAYGEEHGHELLTTRKFPCDEELAWRLTALAAKLNNAQGAYRAPAGTALLFLTFGKVTLAK